MDREVISSDDRSDLLHSCAAIAEYLNIRERQARHYHQKGHLPTFKIGRSICARKSTLLRWMEEQERGIRLQNPYNSVT